MRTNIDQDGSDGTTTLSSATKRENNVPEDWEVAIIDLAQFEKYKTNVDNTQVQVRISTESNIFDIAYAAIVDDLTEAEMAAMLELGATQYRLYEDWSKVGTDVSLNGQEPEVPIDLSFVNQEFGILGMGVYNGTKSSLPITEEGVDFMRFNFTETGHVLFYGNNKLAAGNNFIDITGDTGRYFIVKYRSTNNANIILEALTSDYEYDDAGSNLAMKTKTAGKIQSGVWETAVIDLSVFTNSSKGTQYTTDADLNVWIRFTTGASEIDISYIAIVDDLDEANTFIKYKGDTSFVHYIDWSKTGTTVAVQ